MTLRSGNVEEKEKKEKSEEEEIDEDEEENYRNRVEQYRTSTLTFQRL